MRRLKKWKWKESHGSSAGLEESRRLEQTPEPKKRFAAVRNCNLTITELKLEMRTGKPAAQRLGVSIIEVLISMAVATIGVFGVMALIPFAVNQSQKGLDNDLANAFGRNAIEH